MNKNPNSEFVPLAQPPLSPAQQSFINRVHQTENLVTKSATVTDQFPSGLSIEQRRLAICAADTSLRAEITADLREYLDDLALFQRLRNLLETRDARAKLLAKGYTMSIEQHEAAFEQHSPEEVRAAAIKSLHAQARARLDAKAHPINCRTAQRVIEHIESDLARLPEYECLHRAYQVHPPTVLRDAMSRAIAQLREAVSKPFDSTWHPDAVTRFGQIFGVDFHAELAPPPPAPPAPPAAPSEPASPPTLRTAADIASARG